MPFPIKVCAICGQEFELRPDKPGFANRCPECTESEATESSDQRRMSAEERKAEAEVNEEQEAQGDPRSSLPQGKMNHLVPWAPYSARSSSLRSQPAAFAPAS